MIEQVATRESTIWKVIENISPFKLQSNIDRLAMASGGRPFSEQEGGRPGCYKITALTLSTHEIDARREVASIFQETGIPETDIYEHPMAVFGMLRSKNLKAPTLVIGSRSKRRSFRWTSWHIYDVGNASCH